MKPIKTFKGEFYFCAKNKRVYNNNTFQKIVNVLSNRHKHYKVKGFIIERM